MDRVIHSPFRLLIGFLLGLFITLNVTSSFATNGPLPQVNWVEGGRTIPLGNNIANLNLPPGYLFANSDDTAKLMKYLGNPISKQDIGLVVANIPQKDWFVVFSYDPMGYVKDDDAKSIDKNAILDNIKTATEAGNKERQTQGVQPLIITGWQEEPRYDPVSHSLIWAVAATGDGGKPVVNYNTRKLGRGGVTSINLVASPADLPSLKPVLEQLVDSYEYAPGNKYSDFVAGQDKVAEMGLIALIAGGSAAKTGVFGKILLFLAVTFKKVWIFFAIGASALFKKMFDNKSSPNPAEVDLQEDPNKD